MTQEQMKVLFFQLVFNQKVSDKPVTPDKLTIDLRTKLIDEEFEELKTAFANENLIEIADALGDLLYVIYGTANSCGIDLQNVFDEIHKSNMTKIGGTVNEYGKLLKPESYKRPVLKNFLTYQHSIFEEVQARWGVG